MAGRVPRRRDEDELPVTGEVERGRERPEGRTVEIDEPRDEPRRPVLRNVAAQPAAQPRRTLPLDTGDDDVARRERRNAADVVRVPV